jgi:hypothetical protein
MRISKVSSHLGLVLLLLAMDSGWAMPRAQRLAPVVGRWRIDLNIEGESRSMEFETDDEGVSGIGTGYFALKPLGTGRTSYPAVWWNIDPQQIRITSEIDFPPKGSDQKGTLVLRTTLVPGQSIKGDARFIDEALVVHKGSFTMTRIPESQLLHDKIK